MSKKVDLLLDEPCPELLCGLCSGNNTCSLVLLFYAVKKLTTFYLLDVLEDPMQVHCPEGTFFYLLPISIH